MLLVVLFCIAGIVSLASRRPCCLRSLQVVNELQFPGDMAMGPDSWSTQTLMRHNRRDDRGRAGDLAGVCMATVRRSPATGLQLAALQL